MVAFGSKFSASKNLVSSSDCKKRSLLISLLRLIFSHGLVWVILHSMPRLNTLDRSARTLFATVGCPSLVILLCSVVISDSFFLPSGFSKYCWYRCSSDLLVFL